ncbi:AMIN-like domain-containing (lipo)protein [Mycetocola miduiensis]|uniref:AMIN-like domain-containing protein n=1 Tax=Mycetocola miduiensis TaxID=995034 RepID=A0A1I5B3B4_9MICO|nr:hypothetical protein [Mycetocola miduiensis]SFN69172.1 hypothetical protein SAMN05216219_1702 [Mycetocola miduiensis]
MKRSIALLIGMLLGAVFLVSTGPAATAAPYCGITWGSLPESQSIGSMDASLTNVRAGQHPCYDRLVLDVRGDVQGYFVEYGPVVRDGIGTPVPLRGAGDLRVIALVPDNLNGVKTYNPANETELVNVTGYSTFRQVSYAGSHEGQTTIGLGVRARLPFRAFILDGPGTGSRLVVDVAHFW